MGIFPDKEMAKGIRPHTWPRETGVRTTLSDIILSLVGTLLVVALLNIVVGWYLEKHTFNRGYWLITEKSRLLFSLREAGYWLILGDSSGNMGIVPEILDRELGVRSVNLCTIADMLAVGDLFMLEAYLRRCGRPAGVLLVHTYNAWPRKGEPGAFGRSQWSLWQIKDGLGMSHYEFAKMVASRYCPLFAESTTIKAMSLTPWTSLLAFLENGPFHLEPNGLMVQQKPVPSGVLADARLHLNKTKGHQPFISQANLRAIRDIKRLAELHKFNVYLISSPLYIGLWRDQEFRRYFDEMQENVRRAAQDSKRLILLSFGVDLTFSKDEMENADHVIYSAAKVYTARVAARIRSARSESFSPPKNLEQE